MSDQEFREIQLTAKQLFFLFMSAVVVAVVIFLLGVSVGRGVQGEAVSAAADTGAVSDTVVTASTPPASTPAGSQTPNLTYDPKLQGGPVPPPAAPQTAETTKPADAAATPPPAPEKPAAVPDKTAAAPPSTTKPASGAGEVPPIRPEAKPAPPAPSGLALQVGAFSSRENAETLVGTLKSKGYPAFMVAQPQSKASFAVRVGPFASRAEADKTSARLAREEGMKPLVIAR
jgi:cell division septation protein DedD